MTDSDDEPNFSLDCPEHIDLTTGVEAEDVFEQGSESDDVPPTPLVTPVTPGHPPEGDGEPGAPPRDGSLHYEMFKHDAIRDQIHSDVVKKARYQEVTAPELPTRKRTPSAIYKLDKIMFNDFECFPTMGIARQMKASFKSTRIKQLVEVNMRYRELSDLVDREWKEIERSLFSGHLMFGIWNMLGYCGYCEDIS